MRDTFNNNFLKEKSKLDIFNNIDKSGFDPLIIHQPTFEIEPFYNLKRFKIKDFTHFTIGEKYNIGISSDFKIFSWIKQYQ